MGTIVPRQRADGSTAYLAQISISKDGKRVHSEAQTFDRRPAATAWIKRREKELRENPELLGRDAKARDPILAEVIDLYTADSLKEIGKTKAQVLAKIKEFDIATKRSSKITSVDIVDFARELSEGRKPQTVANYLSHLAAVFAIARVAWGAPLDEQAMKDAFKATKRLGVTGKSRERDRRPTLDELDRLLTYFEDIQKRRPSSNPMARIVVFALFSTRRQDEIVRLQWRDYDEAGGRILVRDMKHPGQKVGNDVWCDLPEPAAAVLRSMPRGTSSLVFPYSTDAISASFTRACKFLEIEDFHFHDLRHEGVSRLFEMGYSIPKAAAVSGHRSWASLRRYTHLRDEGDRYAGWKWLDALGAERATTAS